MTMSLSVARPIVSRAGRLLHAPRTGTAATPGTSWSPGSTPLAAWPRRGDIWVRGAACEARRPRRTSAGGAAKLVGGGGDWSDTRRPPPPLVGYTGCPGGPAVAGRAGMRPLRRAARVARRRVVGRAGRPDWLARGLRGRPRRPGWARPRRCASTRFAAGARPSLVAPDLERQLRPVGIADVDALAVVDVDHRHPAAVDESSVERAVVDRQPPALVEAQQQVGARDQRVRDAHVGAEVAPDHHVMACGEGAFRPVMPNGQRGRGWLQSSRQL